jgi:hypothetical protein
MFLSVKARAWRDGEETRLMQERHGQHNSPEARVSSWRWLLNGAQQ